MVKKLTKYEIYAFSRTMLPMFLILLGVGLLTRFVQFFEQPTTAYNIILTSSIVALVISIIVSMVMTVFVAISRYYKNLFSLEGYLSFTLPVTPAQHIFTKLLVSVMFTFISLITSIIAVIISLETEVLHEVIIAAKYLLNKLLPLVNNGHLILYIIEVFILFISVISCQMLLFYFCMTLGQLANKNRVLLSFGIYFAYYFITQILGTILMVVFTAFSKSFEKLFALVGKFAVNHTYAFIHCLFLFAFVITAVLSAIYYIISNFVIRKKLNLE